MDIYKRNVDVGDERELEEGYGGKHDLWDFWDNYANTHLKI